MITFTTEQKEYALDTVKIAKNFKPINFPSIVKQRYNQLNKKDLNLSTFQCLCKVLNDY